MPGTPPLISASVYARAPRSGTVRFTTTGGGITCELMFCVAPVIVRFTENDADDAAGVTITVQVLPEGVMEVLLGTLTPEKEPAPSSASGFAGIVVLLSNGTPFQKYCAVGF